MFAGVRFATAILPTEWMAAPRHLDRLLTEVRPDLALHFGVSGRARGFEIETRACNRCAVSPDASGALPPARAIHEGGAAHVGAGLPVQYLVARLRRRGIPAFVSRDAGEYLCNATLYHSAQPRARGEWPARRLHPCAGDAGAARRREPRSLRRLRAHVAAGRGRRAGDIGRLPGPAHRKRLRATGPGPDSVGLPFSRSGLYSAAVPLRRSGTAQDLSVRWGRLAVPRRCAGALLLRGAPRLRRLSLLHWRLLLRRRLLRDLEHLGRRRLRRCRFLGDGMANDLPGWRARHAVPALIGRRLFADREITFTGGCACARPPLGSTDAFRASLPVRSAAAFGSIVLHGGFRRDFLRDEFPSPRGFPSRPARAPAFAPARVRTCDTAASCVARFRRTRLRDGGSLACGARLPERLHGGA